jgi:hypothetical protein
MTYHTQKEPITCPHAGSGCRRGIVFSRDDALRAHIVSVALEINGTFIQLTMSQLEKVSYSCPTWRCHMSTLSQNLIRKRCAKTSYCLFGSCNQWYIHPTYNFAYRKRIIQWALLLMMLLQIVCGSVRVRNVWKIKVVVVSKVVVTSKVPVVVVKKAVTGKLIHAADGKVLKYIPSSLPLNSNLFETMARVEKFRLQCALETWTWK